MTQEEINAANKKWYESWLKDPIFKQKHEQAKKQEEDNRRLLNKEQQKK
jgi:hypothetical protein